MFTNKSKTVKV